MESCMEAHGLTKRYGKFTALDRVDLLLPAGGVIGLLGPNGSGKTTIIKLAMGMLQPSEGSITVCGHTPGVESKKLVSYLPDVNFLTEWMRIEQMVDYCADFFEDFSKEKAYHMIGELHLDRKQKISTLSKGNKEKMGLILAMARNAKLYILDEPIAGVDPAARDYILATIMNNRAPDSTVLLCTHLIYDVQSILTQAVFLQQGRVALNAPVKELCEERGQSLDEIFREVFRW